MIYSLKNEKGMTLIAIHTNRDLSNNQLTGPIPSNIGGLTKLNTLLVHQRSEQVWFMNW